MWRIPKVPNGYSKYFDEWSERDLRDMVRRDRNHPSIILWSIGNEIPEQKQPDGGRRPSGWWDSFMKKTPRVRPPRPSNNWSDAIRNQLADQVDIPGFNYKPMRYHRDHEGTSKLDYLRIGKPPPASVRAAPTIFPSNAMTSIPRRDQQLRHHCTPVAYCPDVEFTYQDRFPSVLESSSGPGLTYLGEPTPILDGAPITARLARAQFLLRHGRSRRLSQRPILPLPECMDEQTDGAHPAALELEGPRRTRTFRGWPTAMPDEVELFLDGQSLGRKKRFSEPVELPVGSNVSADGKFLSKYRLLWLVPYQPGT